MPARNALDYLVDRLALRNRVLRIWPFAWLRKKGIVSRQGGFSVTDLKCTSAGVLRDIENRGVAQVDDIGRIAGNICGALIRQVADRGISAWIWPGGDLPIESEGVFLQNPALYALGLDAELLDLAEGYLREPCLYLGCSLKREDVTNSTHGTRQWHRDIEDDRLLRLVIYLNDVEQGGGPFQYLDRLDTTSAARELRYRSGYVADGPMSDAVDTSRWHEITAGCGTTVAFDGTQIFHRIQRPIAQPRFSLSLTYSTRHPRQILRPVRLGRSSRERVVRSLSLRQARSVPQGRFI